MTRIILSVKEKKWFIWLSEWYKRSVGYDDLAIHIDGVSDERVDLLLALDETDGSMTTREVVEMVHQFINENKKKPGMIE